MCADLVRLTDGLSMHNISAQRAVLFCVERPRLALKCSLTGQALRVTAVVSCSLAPLLCTPLELQFLVTVRNVAGCPVVKDLIALFEEEQQCRLNYV